MCERGMPFLAGGNLYLSTSRLISTSDFFILLAAATECLPTLIRVYFETSKPARPAPCVRLSMFLIAFRTRSSVT